MGFSRGTRLGSYEITSLLGAGGMGEVYRAKDLELGRDVAIKVLRKELASEPAGLKRFEQEARTASALNHPNITTIYHIGEHQGMRYIVMEYVDGKTLREMLRDGPLPSETLLEFSTQIAGGLAKAHSAGIVHRDLKPENLMVTDDGFVKILDFGLAKLTGPPVKMDSGMATMTKVGTREGTILGTVQYMSPEQASGRSLDYRSDQFSLGLVLQEMATGEAAFKRDTAAATLAAIIEGKAEPMTGLDPKLPESFRSAVWRCLIKDPEGRYASTTDLVKELEQVRAAFSFGDPLSAAIARGETPAPEIVAAAGTFSGLSPAVAWTCLSSVVLSLAGALWISSQTRLSQITPLPKSPELLIADARTILEDLGFPTPQRDSTYGFSRRVDYIDELMSSDRSNDWWELLARGEPSVVRFWYRESPQYLVPHRVTEFFPAERDPPDSLPGMVSLQLDTFGRLRRLEAFPPDLTDSADETKEPDWTALFAAAGLDQEDFTSAEPRWSPPRFASRRAAWEGTYPDAPEIPVRIETASFAGRPTSFRVVEPWSEPAGERENPWVRPSDVVPNRWASAAHVGLHLLFMFTLAILARRNLKLGRGDRKIAFRLGSVLFASVMLHWIFAAHHVPERSQLQIFFGALYRSFFSFGLAWLFYISLEPYARKLWPRSMISWVRLLYGRFRDPLVGRDVLVGCVYGIGFGFLNRVLWLAPTWLGDAPPPRPDLPRHPAEFIALRGVSESLSQIFANLSPYVA